MLFTKQVDIKTFIKNTQEVASPTSENENPINSPLKGIYEAMSKASEALTTKEHPSKRMYVRFLSLG